MQVRKAVITAAGYGTRFLPATKNVPKELLPIINKPTIHYIVEECINAGIRDIILVTRFGNSAIEDYFDSTPALEQYLIGKGKLKEAQMIKGIYASANFIFIRQNPDLPYGNAAPLYSAKDLINGEPFLYCYGDDIVQYNGSYIGELIKKGEETDADVVLNCVKVDDKQIPSLGIAKIKEGTDDLVEHIVEKPKLEESPGNIASVAAYFFKPSFLDLLDPSTVEPGKEFMIQPAIDQLTKEGKVRASVTDGKWLSIGDPLNYLRATVEIALTRDDLKDDFLKYLKERMSDL